MKRLVAIVTVACVLLSLCGCTLNSAQAGFDAIYQTATINKGELLSGDQPIAVASNESFRLNVIPDTGYFEVIDLSDGYTYSSSPALEDESVINADVVADIKSTLTLEYGDLTNRVTASAVSYTDSILANGHTVYATQDGFIEYYNFPALSITVPVSVTLNEQGLSAEVLVGDIKEEGKYTATKISLLGHFAAAGYKEDGYIVVPDGSGAVINFSNGKHTYPSLSIPVYGTDASLGEAVSNPIGAYMPIFGIKNQNHSYLAVIEKGDANSYINASVAGNNQSFNRAYASFVIRDDAIVSVGTTSVGYSNKTYTIYDETEQTLNAVAVKYILLSGDNADYSGMASTYGEYLKPRFKNDRSQSQKSLLYLNMVCSVNVEQNTLGFTRETAIFTASFDKTEKLISRLNENGADNLSVRLEAWNKSDIKNSVVKTAQPIAAVGKTAELEKLSRAVTASGGSLYAAIDIFHIKPSNKYGTRSINKRSVEIYPIAQNTLKYDANAQETGLLSPLLFEDTAEKLLDTMPEFAMGLSFSTEKDGLYSDFGDSYSKRQNTAEILKNVYSNAAQIGIADMKPAAFLVPYLGRAFWLGGDFLHYDVEDYQIPFYQLAVANLVEYSYEPINLSLDSNTSFMRSLEYGAGLTYTLITENSGEVSRSDNTALYNCEADKLFEGITENYNTAKAFYAKVGDTLLAHDRLYEDVYISEYTSGVAVFNYSQSDFTYGGTVIPANSYAIVGSGVEQ